MNGVLRVLRRVCHDVYVNGLAGSELLPSHVRYLLLRAFPGFDMRRCIIEGGVQWWGSGPVSVGARAFINRGCLINHSGSVTIGDDVALGPGCALITASHETGPASRRAADGTTAPVTVGVGAWLGARVTVMPGVTIGPGAVIGAGSLVLADVPPNTVYAGAPAKFVRDLSADVA